ncbi:hypothetical protein K523DRAFT_359012 [Schizophyllum commune Tattone D]|nr:hypothetical protein K523DRAFT_359012 [Schizophyllum commune Tattone D]
MTIDARHMPRPSRLTPCTVCCYLLVVATTSASNNAARDSHNWIAGFLGIHIGLRYPPLQVLEAENSDVQLEIV